MVNEALHAEHSYVDMPTYIQIKPAEIRLIRQATSHAAPHHLAALILRPELQNPAFGAGARLSFPVVSGLLGIRFHNREICDQNSG